MADWGAEADAQESTTSSSQQLGSLQYPSQATVGAPMATKSAGLPNPFLSGPLSKPFISGSGNWNDDEEPKMKSPTSVEQGSGIAPHSSKPLAHPSTSISEGQNVGSNGDKSEGRTPASDAAHVSSTKSHSTSTPGKPAEPLTQGPVEEKAPAASEQSLFNKLLRKNVVAGGYDLDVQQKDPNSPLHSVKTFEGLPLREEIRKALYSMGFNRPSKIQETALPLLLADPPQNLIAQSQSGTGKTAAFVLAMISRVDESQAYPQAIVLAPTLELAGQIGDVCKKMLQNTPNIQVTFATRGQQVPRNAEEQVIIGTPGTMLDWLKRKAFDPKKIKVFVLDEADVMISQQGHQAQSMRVQKMLCRETQMMLFSATYDQPVMAFAKQIILDPVTITLKRQEESLDNIKQWFIEVGNEEEKFEALSTIYGMVSIGQAMVFCRTRESATWLAGKMSQEGHATAVLTGDLETHQRLAVLQRFRDKGRERLLITTNVCARGIDIEQVSLVVNYDIPYDVVNRRPDVDTYLHRIGRTGRFGKTGNAINFVDGRRSFENLMAIQRHFGRKIDRLDLSNAEQVAGLDS